MSDDCGAGRQHPVLRHEPLDPDVCGIGSSSTGIDVATDGHERSEVAGTESLEQRRERRGRVEDRSHRGVDERPPQVREPRRWLGRGGARPEPDARTQRQFVVERRRHDVHVEAAEGAGIRVGLQADGGPQRGHGVPGAPERSANGTIVPKPWWTDGSPRAAATAGAARSPLSCTTASARQCAPRRASSVSFRARGPRRRCTRRRTCRRSSRGSARRPSSVVEPPGPGGRVIGARRERREAFRLDVAVPGARRRERDLVTALPKRTSEREQRAKVSVERRRREQHAHPPIIPGIAGAALPFTREMATYRELLAHVKGEIDEVGAAEARERQG